MITNYVILGFFGGQEIIVVLILVLVLFGGTKIPQLMRGLGRGLNEFKKAKAGIYDELDDIKKEDTPKEADKKESK